jgi:hypothetical protein
VNGRLAETFFHNSNDLEGGPKNLVQGPEYLYLFEFLPEKFKPDGSYHQSESENKPGWPEARGAPWLFCAGAAKEQKVRLDAGARTFRRRVLSIFSRRGAE